MKVGDVIIGQKVKSHREDGSNGLIGTIVYIEGPESIEVQFSGWSGGHGGIRSHSDSYDRWFLSPDDMELLHEIPQSGNLLPSDAKERKQIPIGTGVLDYFPAALAEVAKVSFKGNEQHNPGEPLHWARGKSTDQFDTMVRHGFERGTRDTDGQRHSAKMAWRALAILQLELEAEGAPVARGAK